MIAVIADDFSGAAEIANAAVQAGLSAEVQLRFEPASGADLICVDTETRSFPAERAADVVGKTAQAIAASRPDWVFKKCDSVLRGSVAAEALAAARALGRDRVLLIPANPSRRRIIRGGEYFIDGIPLAQTAFADDPEYPRRTSRIAELVGSFSGVDIPDITSAEDLSRQAARLDGATLPAGGVDFFQALLAIAARPVQAPAVGAGPSAPFPRPRLFVCGSHAAWLAGRGEQCTQHGIPVHCMPGALFDLDLKEDVLDRWAMLAAAALRERGAALLAIGGDKPVPGLTTAMLVERLAQAVELVLDRTAAACLLVEGGATAAALVRQLDLPRFRAGNSPGAGIGALRPVGRESMLLLSKPGSYPWPETVWGP